MQRFLSLVCLLLALAGCTGFPTAEIISSPTSLPMHSPNPLAGTHWNLVSMNGQPLFPGSSITLEFSSDEIYGTVNCGSYGRPVYAIDKQIIKVGVIQDKGVECTPDSADIQHNSYIELLFENNPTDYLLVIHGSDLKLEILDSKGEPVLVYDAA